jgi:hypothetical protein
MSSPSKHIITCVRCHATFEPIEPGMPNQAYHCACDVSDEMVIGGFGSTVLDIENAEFVFGTDHGLPNGQICDACIKSLQQSGDLVEHFPYY